MAENIQPNASLYFVDGSQASVIKQAFTEQVDMVIEAPNKSADHQLILGMSDDNPSKPAELLLDISGETVGRLQVDPPGQLCTFWLGGNMRHSVDPESVGLQSHAYATIEAWRPIISHSGPADRDIRIEASRNIDMRVFQVELRFQSPVNPAGLAWLVNQDEFHVFNDMAVTGFARCHGGVATKVDIDALALQHYPASPGTIRALRSLDGSVLQLWVKCPTSGWCKTALTPL